MFRTQNDNPKKGHDLVNNINKLCEDISDLLELNLHSESAQLWNYIHGMAQQIENNRPTCSIDLSHSAEEDQNSQQFGSARKNLLSYLRELKKLFQEDDVQYCLKFLPQTLKRIENILNQLRVLSIDTRVLNVIQETSKNEMSKNLIEQMQELYNQLSHFFRLLTSEVLRSKFGNQTMGYNAGNQKRR